MRLSSRTEKAKNWKRKENENFEKKLAAGTRTRIGGGGREGGKQKKQKK